MIHFTADLRACLEARLNVHERREQALEGRRHAAVALVLVDSDAERHDGDPLTAGDVDMSAVAELVCQSCGKTSRSKVPRRTDTMPACPCGGRRQIVRIVHRLHSGARLTEPTDQHQR